MRFLSPVFFWSFVSLIPLALIYLLKVRPRRKLATAYFLWEHIFQERRPNRLFQRLRDIWSLLLMALAFSAICLALTRPEVDNDQRKDVLLLIDNSASMNTVHGSKSRLDLAKQAATEILRGFNGAQRAAVATVGDQTEYRSHLTDNPRELLNAVAAIEPTDFRFRSSLLTTPIDKSGEPGWLDNQRVVLISDGCFDTTSLPKRFELLKVGESTANVGIVEADLRRLPGEANQLGLYIQLQSTYSSDVEVDLLVYQGEDAGNLFRLIPAVVHPGLNDPLIVALTDASGEAWQVRLDMEDGLANDNIARLAVPPSQPIRVQVASENRFFFENSVLAFSGTSGLLKLVTSEPDIVIEQGSWQENDRSIVFQPAGESILWSKLGKALDNPVPKLLVPDHPILRHIEVSAMSFLGAVELAVPDTAQVLVASDNDVPLLYRVLKNGKTTIVVNLDPIAADFYLSAWFPVLVHGAATHLAGREDRQLSTYRPGDSVPIRGHQEGVITRVMPPADMAFETTGNRFDSIDCVGFYNLTNSSGRWTVASSMLSRQESNIDNSAVADTSKAISRGWPLSQLLTLAAVILLAVESVLYQRRKVG